MIPVIQYLGKHAGTLTHFAYIFAYRKQLTNNRPAKLLADEAMNLFVANDEYHALIKANQSLDYSLGHLRWTHRAFTGLPKDGSSNGAVTKFLDKNILRRWATPALIHSAIDDGLRENPMKGGA